VAASLWALEKGARDALYSEIQERFIKDDTDGRLTRLLFVAAKVRGVVRAAVGEEATKDAGAFVEAVARDGRQIADFLRPAVVLEAPA
jgi:hypothetical protein